jgi:hypothetical protein
VIVLIANALVLAALVLTAWAINHLHLPLDLAHTLAAQVVTALVTVVALAELSRFRARHRRITPPAPAIRSYPEDAS